MREINGVSEVAGQCHGSQAVCCPKTMELLKRRPKHQLSRNILHTLSQANMTFDNLFRNSFTCTKLCKYCLNITLVFEVNITKSQIRFEKKQILLHACQ